MIEDAGDIYQRNLKPMEKVKDSSNTGNSTCKGPGVGKNVKERLGSNWKRG